MTFNRSCGMRTIDFWTGIAAWETEKRSKELITKRFAPGESTMVLLQCPDKPMQVVNNSDTRLLAREASSADQNAVPAPANNAFASAETGR